jgi:hypothetical protein
MGRARHSEPALRRPILPVQSRTPVARRVARPRGLPTGTAIRWEWLASAHAELDDCRRLSLNLRALGLMPRRACASPRPGGKLSPSRDRMAVPEAHRG